MRLMARRRSRLPWPSTSLLSFGMVLLVGQWASGDPSVSRSRLLIRRALHMPPSIRVRDLLTELILLCGTQFIQIDVIKKALVDDLA